MKNLRNSVRLIGRLGQDPEIKTLENGNKVARLSIATSDYYTDADGNKVQDTQWHKIVAWGKLADICENLLLKGYEVAVEGKLTTRNYTDKDGIKRYITEVVIDQMERLQKNTDSQTTSNLDESSTSNKPAKKA
jgi:single-strand DNA-binding protein